MKNLFTNLKRQLTKEIGQQLDYLNEMLECANQQHTYDDGKGYFWFHGNICRPRDVRKELFQLKELRMRRLTLNNF